LKLALLDFFKDFQPLLFLIYKQKYYYARSFNKLYEVFVCARSAGSCSWIVVNKREAKCTLLIMQHLLLLFFV